jgi:hypothetical protein
MQVIDEIQEKKDTIEKVGRIPSPREQNRKEMFAEVTVPER